jgi:hypothetical protein
VTRTVCDDCIHCPLHSRDLGGGAECARRQRLVHHPAVADADRHGRTRRQHHLDRCALSRTTRHRIDRPGGCGGSDRAHDAKAIRDQPRRRRPWRAHSPRHAAVDLRPPRAVAGPVRDRALRLGQLFRKVAGPSEANLSPHTASAAQFFIALYGGYFGRYRPLDDGGADHDGLGGAQRGRGQEHSRRRGQRGRGCDLRLFHGLALAAGARHRGRRFIRRLGRRR